MRVVATAGHVDHGKSALLKRLTGMEPDRWDEERRRGLTIDLGYVWTELSTPDGGTVTVAFVDVPGHDDFLANMLCGVGVVDEVLFVVAADDGWSAQSQEHLEILDLLGRRALAAVVTKAGIAGPHRTDEVVADVRVRLAGTALADAPVLAVDSLSGTGVDALVTTLAERLTASAPPSPHAVDAIPAARDARAAEDGMPAAAAAVDGTPAAAAAGAATRLWVDRAFTVRGAGTVVTGMLVSGRLAVGQDVEVAPHGARGRIRGMHQLERDVRVAGPGERVAINLAGVELDDVGRGDALVEPGTTPRRGEGPMALDVQLRALPHAEIGQRGAWHVHLGTATTTARVLPLLDDLAPGTNGPVRLELTDPLPVRVGDRFVLREAGRRRTVGGGVVLDPAPTARRRGTEPRLAHALVLDALATASDLPGRVTALVDAHDGIRRIDDLRAALGTAPSGGPGRREEPGKHAGSGVLGALEGSGELGDLVVVGDVVVRRNRVVRWTEAVLAEALTVAEDTATDLARLTAAASRTGCPAHLAAGVVDRAVAEGGLHRYGGRFVHAAHDATYRGARASRREHFLDVLGETPWAPPDPADAARTARMPSFEVQALVDAGEVVASGGLLFTPDAVTSAAARLREGPGRDGAPFSASDARQAWDCSRRTALPLLEHLRATGVTTFDGTHHRITRS